MKTSMPSPPERPFVLHARVVTGVGGGPEKTILNSPRYLAAAGFDSACLFMHPPHDSGFAELARKGAAAEAEVISLPDRGPWDLRVLWRLVRLCRKHGVTIWHGHDYKSNALGLAVRKLHPMRLVTTVHGWVKHTRRTPLYYRVDKWSLKRYERVLCVSPDLVNECRSAGVSTDRLRLVENGIIAEEYHWANPEVQGEMHDRFGTANGKVVIGAMGRLSAEKGFDLLIDAVSRLVREGQNVRLLIAGDGDQAAALQRRIHENNCERQVQLVGYLPDPREFLRSLDVFALSSLREGLPNVVLEAMATGLPVVATNIAGVPRAIRDGVNGLLVEPGRIEPLRDQLRKVVTSVELRRRLGAAARQTVAEQFSFARRMDLVCDLYRELLSVEPNGCKKSTRVASL